MNMFDMDKKYKVGDLVEMKFQDRTIFAKVTKISEDGKPLEYEIDGKKQKTLEGLSTGKDDEFQKKLE